MIRKADKVTALWRKILDVEIVNKKNKGKELADSIQSAIIDGSLAVGDQILPQSLIIDRLKISKSTVQWAFDRLKADGFIETDGGFGAWVKDRFGSTIDNPVESHGKEYLFNVDDLPVSPEFNKKITALNGAAEMRFENLNPNEKMVTVNPKLKRKLRFLLNNELPGRYNENEVYYHLSRQNAIFNIFTLFLKSDEVFVIANPAEVWLKQAINTDTKRTVLIRYDESGPSIMDLKEACRKGKLGILYLNSRSSFSNNRLISKKRIKEILDLQQEYQFLIIEDDMHAGMFRGTNNIFMELAHQYGSNTIYLRSLTRGYYKTNPIIALAGSEENISIIKKGIVRSGTRMYAGLCATVLELLENGDLMRNENRNYHKVLRINEITRDFLNASGLWKSEGINNREGVFFHLDLLKGKLPDDLYDQLVKRRIYPLNPDIYQWIPGSKKGIMISIGRYVADSRLIQDLEHLLGSIKDIAKL